METDAPVSALGRRATTPFIIWSGVGVLTLLTVAYVRYSEGASGPWGFAGAAGMFSLVGIAASMGDRGPLITRLIFAAFIAVGAALAWSTAQMRHGYIAVYGFASAWLLFLLDVVIALGLLIARGTRTVGKRLLVAGVGRLLAFYAVIVLAQASGHTRWKESKRHVPIEPTEPR